MEVSVVRPEALSPSDIAAWASLQRSGPALDNAFFSVAFTSAMGRCRRNAKVGVVRCGTEAVAFLPFQERRLGLGTAIGYGVSDAQGLVSHPDLELSPRWLLRSCGLAVWEFDHLAFRLDRLSRWTDDVRRSAVMDVGDGYGAYLRERDRSHHHQFRLLMQKRRKLEREHGELQFEFASQDVSALTRLMEWKSAQYERTGVFDRFARRWVRDLVHLLAASRCAGCAGTLSTLSAGGRLVAAHFGLRTESRLSLWFPAYDVDFSAYSPGLQLFQMMAEGAAANGLQLLDFGKGTEGYKYAMASWDYPVGTGRVVSNPLAGLARRAELFGQRKAEHFVGPRPGLRAVLPYSLSRAGRIP